MRTRKIVLALLTLTIASSAVGEWPRLRYVDVTYRFPNAAQSAFVKLPLLSMDGEVAYTLFCRGGVEPYISKGAPRDLWVVEPFGCRLNEGEVESEETLLGEDGSAYWHTRGMVKDYSELVGRCGDYPEFGRVRHFKLRGFVLTLTFENIQIHDDQVTSFDLNVVVNTDKSITSEVTEQTGYLRPDIGCVEIKIGNEKRMCRDREALVWVECPSGGA